MRSWESRLLLLGATVRAPGIRVRSWEPHGLLLGVSVRTPSSNVYDLVVQTRSLRNRASNQGGSVRDVDADVSEGYNASVSSSLNAATVQDYATA